MVNSIIADYLKVNAGKYKIEDLKKEIVSKGYVAQDFDEAAESLGLIEKKEIVENVKLSSESVLVKKVKKKKWFVLLAFIFTIVALFILGVIVLNSSGYDFYGWNMFGK